MGFIIAFIYKKLMIFYVRKLRKNNTKKIKKKLFIKFVGTWKLNLKLYAKYNVKREIIISLNRKNSILFSGEGVKNKYILFY